MRFNNHPIIFKHLFITLLLLFIFHGGISVSAQANQKEKQLIDLKGTWRFSIGDQIQWSRAFFNDRDWDEIKVPTEWENQGFYNYDGYGWYRKNFDGRKLSGCKGGLILKLGYIDDIDEVFINGQFLGRTGTFPPEFMTAYNAKREYHLPDQLVRFNQSNVIAIRVFDTIQEGGIVSGEVGLYCNNDDREMFINLKGDWSFRTLPHWESINRNRMEQETELMASQKMSAELDTQWTTVRVPTAWENQGFFNYDGAAVYQREVFVPRSARSEELLLMLGGVDDEDWVYFNGTFLGHTVGYNKLRVYTIPPEVYNMDSANVLTVYVKDDHRLGGITAGPVGLIRQSEYSRYMRGR